MNKAVSEVADLLRSKPAPSYPTPTPTSETLEELWKRTCDEIEKKLAQGYEYGINTDGESEWFIPRSGLRPRKREDSGSPTL